MWHPSFRAGFIDMLKASPGTGAWGMMTGVAMVQAGFTEWQAVVMTALVYAGSAQLAALPLMLGGAPLWVVWATAACVNLRFVVFSAHMRPYMMHLPLARRIVGGYLNADLSYIMFVRRYPSPSQDPAEQVDQQAYLLGNCSCNWLTWVLPSLAGVALAGRIPLQWGLGFAGILALLGILCSLATTRLRVLAAVVAGAVAVLAYALPLKLNIVVAIAVAVAASLMLEKWHPAGVQRVESAGSAASVASDKAAP